MSAYSELGVSSRKSDVKEALHSVDRGLYPGAFCKIVPNLSPEQDYSDNCIVMHSDGAGTKSSIAYLLWKETKDPSVFFGIVQDAIVMNIDDILCVGATGPVYLSNTIGRNAILVPKEIVKVLIESFEALCCHGMFEGMKMLLTGGETADTGDLVRTLIVDTTVLCSIPRNKVISTDKISAGDIIIGLSSSGRTKYESAYNSGIGSNGLTLAKHALLNKSYISNFPESFDPLLDQSKAFRGKYFLSDKLEGTPLTIGEALLSPTRTYTPIILKLLETAGSEIHGMIHCSGGGQTKCMNFGKNVMYVKDNLFPCPPVFEAIQKSASIPWNEMYEIFNMGHRFEIYGPASLYKMVKGICDLYDVECRIVGYVCDPADHISDLARLIIKTDHGDFRYYTDP